MDVNQLQGVILAGGLGSRLRSAVPDLPKSMAPVDGKPFMEYQINWLKAHGVTQFILCTGYMSEVIESYFKDGTAHGISVRYSREEEPLGTAGAVKRAEPLLNEKFLLLNGDTFCPVPVRSLMACHVRQNSDLSICVTESAGIIDCGNIVADEHGAVLEFTEKDLPEIHNGGLRRYVSAGYYLVNKRVLGSIPVGGKYSLEIDFFPSLIGAKARVMVFPCDPFRDIGTPERLDAFRENFRAFVH